jgi:hypothetical protein
MYMNASFAGFSTNVLWLAYAPNAETQEGGRGPLSLGSVVDWSQSGTD